MIVRIGNRLKYIGLTYRPLFILKKSMTSRNLCKLEIQAGELRAFGSTLIKLLIYSSFCIVTSIT